MTETNVYRIEDFVELLPPAVGHNLRHWRVEGEHTTGHGCHCQPDQIPHAADELPVRFEEADSIVVLLRCDEDGCDATLLGEYGSKIEHGPGPMHTFTPAKSAEATTIATPSPAEVDYQVLWQNAMDRIASAWDEGYRFGRIQQFDADHVDAPKWPTHNSRASLVSNLDYAVGRCHDNPYRAKPETNGASE